MLRLTVVTLVLAFFACGGGDEDGTGGAIGDVSAPSESAATQTPQAESVGVHPEVESCLGLVGEGDYARALPVCLEALNVDPNNDEVVAAVDQARAQVASADAARATSEAASDAAAAVGDAAAEATAEAAAGIPSEIPQ